MQHLQLLLLLMLALLALLLVLLFTRHRSATRPATVAAIVKQHMRRSKVAVSRITPHAIVKASIEARHSTRSECGASLKGVRIRDGRA